MESENKGWGSGMMAAMWVIAAVIVIALLAYIWNRNCSEKAEIAAGVQKLVGRVDALEPAVTAQGVKDLKQCFGDDIYQLNEEIFYGARRARGGCGGCGNREFKQTSTYNLASTNVTVDETCRN